MRRSAFLQLMGHEMHVSEWGDPSRPALVMWHGLVRTGRDFDELAQALSDRYFVLCPDTIGRGLSGWSQHPQQQYGPVYYAQMALAMLDHYGIAQAAWLGTSLGGIIAMQLASGEGRGRLSGLILNDIGPEIPAEAVQRILTYAGTLPEFATQAEAHDWLGTVYTPFGPAPGSFWTRMGETSVRRRGDGRWTLHYDPAIIAAFTGFEQEMENWPEFDALDLPMHLIRGAGSDILTEQCAARMLRHPGMISLTEMPECGHAPSLARPEDAALVARLLDHFT